MTSATSLGDTGTAEHDVTLEDLAIGELVTYTLTVTFPEGRHLERVVTDQVQATPPACSRSTTRGYSPPAPISTSQSIVAPSPIPAGTTVVHFRIRHGDQQPSRRHDRRRRPDRPRGGGPGGRRGQQRTATHWSTSATSPTSTARQRRHLVDVVEPAMTIAKTMVGPVDGVVTMTVELGNTGTASAYDIVVRRSWPPRPGTPRAIVPGARCPPASPWRPPARRATRR